MWARLLGRIRRSTDHQLGLLRLAGLLQITPAHLDDVAGHPADRSGQLLQLAAGGAVATAVLGDLLTQVVEEGEDVALTQHVLADQRGLRHADLEHAATDLDLT